MGRRLVVSWSIGARDADLGNEQRAQQPGQDGTADRHHRHTADPRQMRMTIVKPWFRRSAKMLPLASMICLHSLFTILLVNLGVRPKAS
jgi:hypothetical protein